MYFGNLTKIATKMINSNDTALCYRQSLEGPIILTFPGIQSMLVFLINCQFSLKRGVTIVTRTHVCQTSLIFSSNFLQLFWLEY